MSKKNYYILSEGILKRKENTIYFHNEKGKKPIPINKIYSIYGIIIDLFHKIGFYRREPVEFYAGIG